MPNKSKTIKLMKIQKMLSEGWDIGSAPFAPFLADEDDEKQRVIVAENNDIDPLKK